MPAFNALRKQRQLVALNFLAATTASRRPPKICGVEQMEHQTQSGVRATVDPLCLISKQFIGCAKPPDRPQRSRRTRIEIGRRGEVQQRPAADARPAQLDHHRRQTAEC